MDIKKTHCETYVTDDKGKPVSVVKKQWYPTIEKAQRAADEQNYEVYGNQKLEPYQCSVCSRYHVGRNGKKVTDDDLDEIWDRTIGKKYKLPDFKLVGTVDLSKFPSSKTVLKRLNKERKRQEELNKINNDKVNKG